jgi:hypothetical protein
MLGKKNKIKSTSIFLQIKGIPGRDGYPGAPGYKGESGEMIGADGIKGNCNE